MVKVGDIVHYKGREWYLESIYGGKGKENVIIDQSPKYDENSKDKLEQGDEITLYIPDIYSEYPDMKSEGWTLSKVEEFAKTYNLTLIVKDSNNKTITDYTNYLSKTIINQNRTGKISSGVSFTVTIDVDTTTYTLTINYYEEGTTKSIQNSKTEEKANNSNGSVTCPGITDYIKKSETVNYSINGKNTSVNCYYTKANDETNENE